MQIENIFIKLKTTLNRFTPIPDSEWKEFESIFEIKVCKKGSTLDLQGLQSENVYFLDSGLFYIFQTSENGHEIVKKFLFENALFSNLESLIGNVPSTHTTKALEDSIVLVAKFSKISEFYLRHICWERLGRKMLERALIDKNKREYEIIALSAKERFESFKIKFSTVLHRIPKKDIASYLGIKPETLSRITRPKPVPSDNSVPLDLI